MGYEVSSKALYNQLLYFRSLWAADQVAGKLLKGGVRGGVRAEGKGEGVRAEGKEKEAEGNEGAGAQQDDDEKVRALVEWNRERFGTCYAVVEAYLKRCGRVWVQMDELFRFALGK